MMQRITPISKWLRPAHLYRVLLPLLLLLAGTGYRVAAQCAGGIFGPATCDAKIYCSNNGASYLFIDCGNAASTDGDGIDRSYLTVPPPGTEPTDACYSAGLNVQWLKFATPMGANQFELDIDGTDAWALYYTTDPNECDYADLTLLTCQTSQTNGFILISNPAIDPTETAYYFIGYYFTNTNGTANFKARRCATASDCTPAIIACPEPGEFDCDDTDGINAWLASVTYDDCDNPDVTVENDFGQTPFVRCTTTITFTLLVDNVVYETCSRTLILNDFIAPEITCPDDYTVECIDLVPVCDPADATATDNCDTDISVTCAQGALVGGPCGGTVTNTYTAEDNCGQMTSCQQLITVQDTQAPTGSCPDPEVMVTCIDEIPCPDPSDPAITTLIGAIGGAFTDNCGGAVTVTLDSWSDLQQCSDPDEDGIYTFGRSFSFKIADDCDNATFCTVRYSGTCIPYCSYTQGFYGNAGGKAGELTTTQVLNQLVGAGNVIDIGSGTCGFSLTSAACVLDLLPAGGPSVPLKPGLSGIFNCKGIKNTLVGQTVTLILNVRYNQIINGLDLGNQLLSATCALTDAQIAATGLNPSTATVNDLIALSNSFLGSLCNGSNYSKSLGGTLTAAEDALNQYWDECMVDDGCIAGAGVAPMAVVNRAYPVNTASSFADELLLQPNPATDQIQVIVDVEFPAEMLVRIYDLQGRLVRSMDLAADTGMNRLDIRLQDFRSGLYLLVVQDGDRLRTKRFVVDKN